MFNSISSFFNSTPPELKALNTLGKATTASTQSKAQIAALEVFNANPEKSIETLIHNLKDADDVNIYSNEIQGAIFALSRVEGSDQIRQATTQRMLRSLTAHTENVALDVALKTLPQDIAALPDNVEDLNELLKDPNYLKSVDKILHNLSRSIERNQSTSSHTQDLEKTFNFLILLASSSPGGIDFANMYIPVLSSLNAKYTDFKRIKVLDEVKAVISEPVSKEEVDVFLACSEMLGDRPLPQKSISAMHLLLDNDPGKIEAFKTGIEKFKAIRDETLAKLDSGSLYMPIRTDQAAETQGELTYLILTSPHKDELEDARLILNEIFDATNIANFQVHTDSFLTGIEASRDTPPKETDAPVFLYEANSRAASNTSARMTQDPETLRLKSELVNVPPEETIGYLLRSNTLLLDKSEWQSITRRENTYIFESANRVVSFMGYGGEEQKASAKLDLRPANLTADETNQALILIGGFVQGEMESLEASINQWLVLSQGGTPLEEIATAHASLKKTFSDQLKGIAPEKQNQVLDIAFRFHSEMIQGMTKARMRMHHPEVSIYTFPTAAAAANPSASAGIKEE